MEKNTLVKVANRGGSLVGYDIPDMHIKRNFAPRETKEIPFEELEQLTFTSGGDVILKEYLIIRDPEALEALNIDVEPEYFYGEDEIKALFVKPNSLDEFLDCLDFAPDGVLDLIKSLAVTVPLNDMSKRQAILEKLGFNVTNAIEIANAKSEEELEAATKKVKETSGRRVTTTVAQPNTSGRRVTTTVSKK